jgi:hypothetical protein
VSVCNRLVRVRDFRGVLHDEESADVMMKVEEVVLCCVGVGRDVDVMVWLCLRPMWKAVKQVREGASFRSKLEVNVEGK